MDGWLKIVKGKAEPAGETAPPIPGVSATSVWAQSGLTVIPNAGGGNCGAHAIASALREYMMRIDCVDVNGKEAMFDSITHLDVRAAVASELRANSSTYSPGIKGAVLRTGAIPGRDDAVVVNEAVYKEYVDKMAKSGRDFDSIEMAIVAKIYPWLENLVFLSDKAGFGNTRKLVQVYFGFPESAHSKALKGAITPALLASLPGLIAVKYTPPPRGYKSGHFEGTEFVPVPAVVDDGAPAAATGGDDAFQAAEEEDSSDDRKKKAMKDADESESDDEDDDDNDNDDDDDDDDDNDDDDDDDDDKNKKRRTDALPQLHTLPGTVVTGAAPPGEVATVKAATGAATGKGATADKAAAVKSAKSAGAPRDAFAALMAGAAAVAHKPAHETTRSAPKAERTLSEEEQKLLDAIPKLKQTRTQYDDEQRSTSEHSLRRAHARAGPRRDEPLTPPLLRPLPPPPPPSHCPLPLTI
jgi:hypothetical protein